MLNKITFVLGIVAFILTSLKVWGFLPRNIPYALCILMIMEFMWGIKTIRENKNNAMKLFLGELYVVCFVIYGFFNEKI